MRVTGKSRLAISRHALLDRRQVFRRERALVGKIVIEAVFDDRADGHLRIGKQLLHRMGQQVRGRMADDLHAIGILVGDDGQRGILRDQMRGIHQLAIHLAGQRGARQASADAERNIGDGNWLRKTALRTIRQSDDWHICYSENTKCGNAAL